MLKLFRLRRTLFANGSDELSTGFGEHAAGNPRRNLGAERFHFRDERIFLLSGNVKLTFTYHRHAAGRGTIAPHAAHRKVRTTALAAPSVVLGQVCHWSSPLSPGSRGPGTMPCARRSGPG